MFVVTSLFAVTIGLLLVNINQGSKIMATAQQAVERLDAINAKLSKIATESAATLQAVADLRTQLESQGEVPPEVEAALARVEESVNAVDALVPDADAAEQPAG